MNAPDNHLERRARELYREASRQLDPAVAAKLRSARRDALAKADDSSLAHRLLQLLLPAGARRFALAVVRAEAEARNLSLAYTASENSGTVRILTAPPTL